MDPTRASGDERPRGRSADHRVPTPVLAVVVALAVEAVLLLLVAGFFVYAVLAERSLDARVDLATAVLCLVVAAVLVACARALRSGLRWARAPVVTLQLLILLALALPALRGDRWWVGAGLAVLSLVAGGGLFAPASMAHTNGRANPPVA